MSEPNRPVDVQERLDEIDAQRLRAIAEEEAHGPATPWEYARAAVADAHAEEAAELERVKVRAAEQATALAAGPAANRGPDGKFHFLTNVAGSERCGGCGEAFPCELWRSTHAADPLATTDYELIPPMSGQLLDDELTRIERAAALLGVDPAALHAALTQPPS